METFIGVITGLFLLVILVVVHELGHALAARRNGVVVEQFGIGFPPTIWSKKLKNGVRFFINWLPLGGYVKLQGEHDADSQKGDYGAATFWQKTKILLAGVVTNWLLAAILLTVIALFGMPRILDNQFIVASDNTTIYQPVQVSSVQSGSPAAKSGLVANDKLLEINGKNMDNLERFIDTAKQNAGKTIELTYEHDGRIYTKAIALRSDTKQGALGVGLGQSERLRATWSAPIVGIVTTAQFSWANIVGLGTTIANLSNGVVGQFSSNVTVRKSAASQLSVVSENVAGPIGILGVLFPSAQKAGAIELLFVTAIISLTLAVMNILPIPGLDGGRWFTTALFRVMRKKLTQEREEKVQMVGVMALMALVILVTISDVAKLF